MMKNNYRIAEEEGMKENKERMSEKEKRRE
jgi:hypothetical protein